MGEATRRWTHSDIPVVSLAYSVRSTGFPRSEPDMLEHLILAERLSIGTISLGFLANRALLRSSRIGILLPLVSSVLWIIALPLMSVSGIDLYQKKAFPFADAYRIGFLERLSMSLNVWFALVALMLFYKLFYLFALQQYRKCSRLSEELAA